MRKTINWIFFILFLLVCALFIIKRFYLLPDKISSYTPPEIYPAIEQKGYYVKVTFDNYKPLLGKRLNGVIICADDSSQNINEFKVADIRIWWPDDTRIIGDKFTVDCHPKSIRIWQITDSGNVDLYTGDLLAETISSSIPEIKNKLIISFDKLSN